MRWLLPVLLMLGLGLAYLAYVYHKVGERPRAAKAAEVRP